LSSYYVIINNKVKDIYQYEDTDHQTSRWISSSGDYIFYYQPTFHPPIQVGFFRAMFSTTKHVAYQ